MILPVRFPKWGVTSLYLKTVPRYCNSKTGGEIIKYMKMKIVFFLVWLPSKSEVKMKDVENISIFLGKSFLEFNLLGYQK